jgi:hypothetical protein
MTRDWPIGTIFHDIVLKNEMDNCPLCHSKMHVCDHRKHKIYTLDRPTRLVCRLVHCSNKLCPNNKKTFSPKKEADLTLPRWKIGWDVFLWIGHRRFKRHWSVPQIREELIERYCIFISADAIEDYLLKYQIIVAARRSDLALMKEEYSDCKHIILSVDGLQPEKGHEVLYVVREVKKGRIWFAEALVSSSSKEIIRIIRKAKDWAEQLGLIVDAWVSDKQDAFVTSIASEFPGVPHRYCKNHFLCDISEETLAIDRDAKIKMRMKVRGLRSLESASIESVKAANEKLDKDLSEYNQIVTSAKIILDFCTIVKGILNDNENGPLDPPGLRMANKLSGVRTVIETLLKTKKKGNVGYKLELLATWIDKGLALYEETRTKVLDYLREIKRVNQTLSHNHSNCKLRLKSFNKILERLKNSKDPVKENIAGFMKRFKDGLFAGGDNLEIPDDNQDLERWFKTPKGHERKINGHKHAGTRIVYEGPILLPTLDAHKSSERQFRVEELQPYVDAEMSEAQDDAISRRKRQKEGRCKKKAKMR